MVIDCDQCLMRDVACRDCVVTVLLGLPDEREAVQLDHAEARAISVLAGSGLVPPLRLVTSGVPADEDRRRSRSREPTRHEEDLGRYEPVCDDRPAYDEARGAGGSRAG